jgi:hypothetical protein
MKFSMKHFLSLALLASSAGLRADSNGNCCATECNPGNTLITQCDFTECCENSLRCCNDDNVFYGRTHYSLRPQGSNAARQLLGRYGRTHVFGDDQFHMFSNLTVEYGQTFDPEDNCVKNLGTWFSPTCSNCTTFGPDLSAATAADNPTGQDAAQATGITQDLKAGVTARSLDFGMSSSHKSTICINPKISTVVADLDFWFGLDQWLCGLWARVNVPLVWTKWEVCSREKELNAGGTNYGPGSIATCPLNSATGQTPAVVYTKQKDAWCGNKPFGQTPALRYGKLCNRKNDDFNVSGLRFDLGYDVWKEECGYVGVGLVGVFGLGTKSCPQGLFQPVVGAQRSWQVGVTINSAYELWHGDNDSSLALVSDTTLTTILKHKQQRLFGLKGRGPWSHYLQLKKFKPDAAGTGFELDGFEHAANILTGYVKIKNDIMIDSAWALAYQKCNWGATLGVDFWYRSRDEITDSCGFGIEERRYGIRGYTQCDTFTASLSTINQSKGVGLNQANNPVGVPNNVDDGYANTNHTIANTVTLTSADVDPCPGLHPDALSGKIFGALEYGWSDCEWKPYALIGGEIEFGRGNAAVDQWGVMFQAGFTY